MSIFYKLLFLFMLFLSACTPKGKDSVLLSSDIGPQIRKVRLGRGMTQKALADSIGMSQDILSLVEDGMATPIHSKLVAIERFFGVHFKIEGEYIGIEEYMNKGK